MSTIPQNNNKTEKRITAEQTIILIRLVKKYKSLWDPTARDFGNRTVCDRLYEKIGRYFELTGKDVRRKFRRFRNCYTQELKMIRDGQKPYSSLFYFDEMEFLKEHIALRLLKLESSNCSTTSNAKDDDHVGRVSEESFQELYIIETENLQASNNELDSTADIIVEELEEEEEEANEIPNVEEEQSVQNASISGEITDEFDIFAGYLASQLREMDKLSALETMEELQQIISKRRISILKRDLTKNPDLKVEYRYSLKRRKEED